MKLLRSNFYSTLQFSLHFFSLSFRIQAKIHTLVSYEIVPLIYIRIIRRRIASDCLLVHSGPQ